MELPAVASSARARKLVHGQVTTCGELDQAIAHAEEREAGAYIEVVTDTYVTSPLAAKLHEARGTLYIH
ncbi:MAG TPA: hypothetical protein VF916_01480 [Ktedonobacterales bacterium]